MKLRVFATALAVCALSTIGSFTPDAFAISQVAEKQMVFQSQPEIEPALITYTHFGTEYSVAVWMDFNPDINTPSTLKYTAWAGPYTLTAAQIPTVAGYERYYDPVLVKHPSLTRIYLVAGGMTSTQSATDTALIVWYSDNGGWNWSSGHVFATDRTTPDIYDTFERVLDKPQIATSPNGTLWVAFTSRPGGNSDLQVMSGVNSGSSWSWSGRLTVNNTRQAQAPLVFVDGENDVYVASSVASGPEGIAMWRGNMSGFTFHSNIPSVGDLDMHDAEIGLQVAAGVTVKAVSVPMGKLDRTRRRISIVWHERNPAGGKQLRFAVYRLDAGYWTNSLFAAGTGVNHVNVGLDYDVNGNVLVSWYRFGGTSVYVNVGKFVTFDAYHNPQWVSDDQITNRLGDAVDLPVAGDGRRHIGEYHDVSYTNGTFKAVHIIAVQPWADPWVFTVQQ